MAGFLCIYTISPPVALIIHEICPICIGSCLIQCLITASLSFFPPNEASIKFGFSSCSSESSFNIFRASAWTSSSLLKTSLYSGFCFTSAGLEPMLYSSSQGISMVLFPTPCKIKKCSVQTRWQTIQ